jgi:transposase
MPKIVSPHRALASVPAADSPYDVFCGIDWSENHHDYCIVDRAGKRLAGGRVPEALHGWQVLAAELDKYGQGQSVPVIIETERGLLVDELRRTHHPVYAVNPKAVHKYRQRWSVSGAKSDKADALLMAHLGRTDLIMHRPLPAETADMLALGQLARAHQDCTWRSRDLANELRSLLREFFPGALIAFKPADLLNPVARVVLNAAPTPAAAARLTVADLKNLLIAAGRVRGVEKAAQRLQEIFSVAQMRRLPAVEQAMGETARALVNAIDGAVRASDELEAALTEALARNTQVKELVDSIPGLGVVSAARIFGEIGDDPDRFHNAAALKAYAGTSPVTVASGKGEAVFFRYVRNSRLHSAAWQWAFMASTHSAGARAHYDRRREAGDRHNAALRNLANRLLGCLHHCLRTGQLWDEKTVFGIEGRPPKRVSSDELIESSL